MKASVEATCHLAIRGIYNLSGPSQSGTLMLFVTADCRFYGRSKKRRASKNEGGDSREKKEQLQQTGKHLEWRNKT